jgi:hypothetical protein
MARDGQIPGERIDRAGKHYRYEDSVKLRAWCAAIKKERHRARLSKPRSSRLEGVATWQGLSMQFDLLHRSVGDTWKNWTGEQAAWVRTQIAPICRFDRKLSSVCSERH